MLLKLPQNLQENQDSQKSNPFVFSKTFMWRQKLRWNQNAKQIIALLFLLVLFQIVPNITRQNRQKRWDAGASDVTWKPGYKNKNAILMKLHMAGGPLIGAGGALIGTTLPTRTIFERSVCEITRRNIAPTFICSVDVPLCNMLWYRSTDPAFTWFHMRVYHMSGRGFLESSQILSWTQFEAFMVSSRRPTKNWNLRVFAVF